MIATDVFADQTTGVREVYPLRERRRTPRHAHRQPLTLSGFNRGRIFKGCMINCSPDGFCAEICHDIRPKTSVHFRIDERPAAVLEGVVCHCFRTTALGEVKWCQASGQGPPQRYLIGIHYYPYY